MLVRDIMTSPVVTVRRSTSLQDACRMMRDRNIRHLPVVDDEGALVGVFTDRDLLETTDGICGGAPPPEGTVGPRMSRPPRTALADDPVEDAARTMRELKIGCLPVVDGDRLVGIVTVIDLLDAILRLTGVHRPGGRLEVRLSDRPGELARLMTKLAERRLNTHSVLTHPENGDVVRVVLRVGTLATRAVADELRGAGFDIVWPPEKPWSK